MNTIFMYLYVLFSYRPLLNTDNYVLVQFYRTNPNVSSTFCAHNNLFSKNSIYSTDNFINGGIRSLDFDF